MGTTAIEDGKVDDASLTWKMDVTVPTPMTLDCKATVSGSTMTGTVTPGRLRKLSVIGHASVT
ncbi:MAG TPA: hypothetical protein VG897_10075, partial [Terriglobales bacterium]|nr:hypothetical protein [Terriglobales bacterium]